MRTIKRKSFGVFWQIMVYNVLLFLSIFYKRGSMKVYHVLLLSIGLMCVSSVIQATSLSSESQKEIAISALKGGLSVAAIYTAGYALFNDLELPSVWEHRKTYAIVAALGAVTMAWWRYNYVPESYFDFAQRELEKVSNNKLIMLVLSVRGADFIDHIKNLYVRESFPLVCAFKQINVLYSRLESIDESLDTVLHSSRSELHGSCYEMQIIVQTIQSALEIALKAIKEEPQFINEYNAQTSLALQQTQAVIAQAAHSQATAAWVHALKN